MNSHSNRTFLRRIATYIAQEQLLSDTSRPLLAISGGRDSMALLSIFLHLNRWSIAVAHFNFKLRGEESERDERHVAQICQTASLPLHIQREETKTWCALHKYSLEEGCRKLRYDFFNTLCETHGYTEIVTAHHAEDQAETILFHISRGCGLEGLRGMRPRNGKIIRPLLATTRRELETWLNQNSIRYVDDSSNETNDYTRNYIRHNVLPTFTKVNKQTIPHLYALGRHADEAYETLRTEAETLWGGIESATNTPFDTRSPMVQAHSGLARFWLRERLQYLQFSESAIDTLFHLLTKGQTGKRVLAKEWEAYIERGTLVIVPRETLPQTLYYPNPEAGDNTLQFRQELIKQALSNNELKQYANRGKNTALFDFNQVKFPLCYRPWNAGDFIQPLGMPRGQKKKVSDLLTDAHYPTHLRRQVCVLVDAHEEILWIPSIRQGAQAALLPTTQHVLVIEAPNTQKD